MSDQTTNGDLPPVRENLVAQAERVHQEILHERDMLRSKLLEANTNIAGLQAQLSVAELEASQLRSRSESMAAIRDEAIARRAEVETVLGTVLAILRAFNIQNTPLVRPAAEEEAYAENLSRDYSTHADDGSDGKGGRQ